jgi:hypothetical protein
MIFHPCITLHLSLNCTSLEPPLTQVRPKKKAKSSGPSSAQPGASNDNITATRRAELTKEEKKAQAQAKRAATIAKKKEQQAQAALAKDAKAAAASQPAPDQLVDKGKKAAVKGSNKEVKSQKGAKKRPRTDTASGGSPCQCPFLPSSIQSYHLTIAFSPQKIEGRPTF